MEKHKEKYEENHNNKRKKRKIITKGKGNVNKHLYG